MILYLDANAIIYSIEGAPALRESVLGWLEKAETSLEGALVTSRLSRLECRVKPLRDGERELLARFDGFFGRGRLTLIELSPAVIERATELRAAHGFRTPDAIHLATAILEGADAFLTGDVELGRCPGLDVVVLAPEV